MRTRLLLATTISALLLTACGVRGSLKTPPPVFGDKDKAAVETPTTVDEPESNDDFIDTEDYFPE